MASDGIPSRQQVIAAALPTAIVIVLVTFVIAVMMSTVNVGGGEVGIVEKKFGGGSLPSGKIIAVNGENGIQAQTLTPGWHFFYWPWQYVIAKVPLTTIPEGQVGLLTAADGIALPPNTIYAAEWTQTDKMLTAEHFLGEGKGYKGPQLTVLKPGSYRLNTRLFTVKMVPVTNVAVGSVAVIKSNIGEQGAEQNRLVEVGQRGIWKTPFMPSKYYLNTEAYEVTIIQTRQQKVSYAREAESQEKGMTLRPITVRSKDGFTFPVDVRLTYLIEANDAPKVVATVGDDELVLDKLITPAVRAIFRNNAEQVKALDYVQQRSKQEEQSMHMLKAELEKYGVTVLAVRIGDIGNEETLGTLLKTQTDREIALQQQATFEEQQRAAEKQKQLTRTTQETEEEKRLATAQYSVKVANQEKEQQIIRAQANAEQVRLMAEAQAEAYRKVSGVIGANNAALIEVMRMVATEKVKITPDVMVGGSSSSGMTDALMGTILRGQMSPTTQPVR